MVTLIAWLPSSSLKVVATPGWPLGLSVGGAAVKGTGALMSLGWMSSFAYWLGAAGADDAGPELGLLGAEVAEVADPDFDGDGDGCGLFLPHPATQNPTALVTAQPPKTGSDILMHPAPFQVFLATKSD
ncbi:hypothetical protein MUNTM_00370 [Mycobacterium sp. MUNTM1]